MKQIIVRKHNMFIIDKSQLKDKAKKDEICTALYAAIYSQFIGANKHPNYASLTHFERMTKINEYANNWLNERGLL